MEDGEAVSEDRSTTGQVRRPQRNPAAPRTILRTGQLVAAMGSDVYIKPCNHDGRLMWRAIILQVSAILAGFRDARCSSVLTINER